MTKSKMFTVIAIAVMLLLMCGGKKNVFAWEANIDTVLTAHLDITIDKISAFGANVYYDTSCFEFLEGHGYGLFTTEQINDYDGRLYLNFSRNCATDSALYDLVKQRVLTLKFHVKVNAETGIPKRFRVEDKTILFCDTNNIANRVRWDFFEVIINILNKFEWIIE